MRFPNRLRLVSAVVMGLAASGAVWAQNDITLTPTAGAGIRLNDAAGQISLKVNADGTIVLPQVGTVSPQGQPLCYDTATGLVAPCAGGITGPTGATGPMGPTGPTGPIGMQGPAGAPGPVGPMGADGADGAPGAQGMQGPVGPAGPAGAAGVTGATGAIGMQGATGATGPMGATGPQGAPGQMGPIGMPGADGAPGMPGPPGPVGPTGPVGPMGPAGFDGADGVTGATGPMGATGATGATGPAGLGSAFPAKFGDGIATTAGTAASGSCVIGEMKLFAGNIYPSDVMPAKGQLLSISGNTALFGLLGTTYGGDGQWWFALPDLRGLGPGNTTWVICVSGIHP